MTSTILQIASEKRIPVSTFKEVGAKLGEIFTLMAGLEADSRRALAEVAILKLKMSGAEKAGEGTAEAPQVPDLSGVLARISDLESKPVAAPQDNVVAALLDEIASLNAGRLEDAKRIADLEAAVGAIGAQFAALASKAA